MSAAIAEHVPQAGIILPGATTVPTATPRDGFMAMLAAVLDAAAPPAVGDTSPPVATPPTIEGPAILAMANAPTPTAIIAITAKPVDPIPSPILAAVSPPPPPPTAIPATAAAPNPGDLGPGPPAIPLPIEVTAAPPTARPTAAKVAPSASKSSMAESSPAPDTAPSADVALQVPVMLPASPPTTLPPPDSPLAGASLSAPATAPADPVLSSGAGTQRAEPLPGEDPAKPRDRSADDPILATATPPPDTAIQQMPGAAPSHQAAAPDATIVRFTTALPGAPPAQAITTQIGAAFVVLSREGGGSHHLTLLLQPPDLGELRITIEQAKDSTPKIALTAANPSTLLTLLRDQAALNKALDSAGISGDGRVVTFHLAAARDSAPVVAPVAGQNPGDAAQSQGSDPNASRPNQSSQTQPDTGGRGGQEQRRNHNEPPAGIWFGEIAQVDRSATPTRLTLTAIDITA